MAAQVETPATIWGRRFATLRRSLLFRLILLALIFGAIPTVLYEQFREADATRQSLLLDTIREKGVVISRALRPLLERADIIPYFRLGEELAKFQTGTVSLKLLFRPVGARDSAFFYVASAPPVDRDALAAERERLVEAGILERLERSCDGDLPLALRVELPGDRAELLTSITPVRSANGCWALVIANRLEEAGDLALGQPYWRSSEIQIAGVIYLALAAVVFFLFFDMWRSFGRFAKMARAIRRGDHTGNDSPSDKFASSENIPELRPLAVEFDRMVHALGESAANLQRASEDTAHAFKTPIGIVRQALEPLRRRVAPGDTRAAQSVETIDAALDRLDALVQTARRLDRVAAELLDPPHDRIDLSALLRALVGGYRAGLPAGAPRLVDQIEDGASVIGGSELLETIAENLMDNAITFTPPGRQVTVRLHRQRRRVVLTVEDEGPGVPADRLGRIFDRYYTDRTNAAAVDPTGSSSYFGVGLWIVRRNVEAMGGRVIAGNRAEGGLRVDVDLPAA